MFWRFRPLVVPCLRMKPKFAKMAPTVTRSFAVSCLKFSRVNKEINTFEHGFTSRLCFASIRINQKTNITRRATLLRGRFTIREVATQIVKN